ncbi:hypothetical protein IW261DRAFT_1607404 [Armillaria novae-zelandiae]|uniref:F-box domain-containing protein n=1 Tax=Armillaria novae-zelandiae TaxID=153914 RepID=A0AA39PCD7_9AGAR|nr:hypothetical protein IW261DRAFT_1607404 [Armillaria novae-zelandiae]
MSCITCRNCGFVNLLSPAPHVPQILNVIQSSDEIVGKILRGSRPLLDADHALLDPEITNLKQLRSWYDALLQEIELHRPTVLKGLKNRESVYAPVRRLPRDLLIKIFHFLCDSWRWDDQYQDGNGKNISERHSLHMAGPLWVLGRVCGLWRDILHTSPASWARYVLVESVSPVPSPGILQTYLKHTGEHPLSLVVICDGDNLTRESEIMSLCIQLCHRWKNVRIETSLDHVHLLESVSHLPILQTFDIKISDDFDSEYSTDMCLDAPQLWQATIEHYGIHQIRLPPSITHYSGNITCEKDLQLIFQLPKLRTCQLTSKVSLDSIKVPGPVIMAELCQLFVEDLDLLDCLTAPMLQSMTISGGSSESFSCIHAFFQRSGCHLESFSIEMEIMESVSSTSISDTFSSEACSTISYFKLGIDSDGKALISSFASPLILPNLRHFVLCFGHHNFFRKNEWPAVLDIIRPRCEAGLLNVIEVQLVHSDRDIIADVQALVGDNLEIRLDKQRPICLNHLSAFWDSD